MELLREKIELVSDIFATSDQVYLRWEQNHDNQLHLKQYTEVRLSFYWDYSQKNWVKKVFGGVNLTLMHLQSRLDHHFSTIKAKRAIRLH